MSTTALVLLLVVALQVPGGASVSAQPQRGCAEIKPFQDRFSGNIRGCTLIETLQLLDEMTGRIVIRSRVSLLQRRVWTTFANDTLEVALLRVLKGESYLVDARGHSYQVFVLPSNANDEHTSTLARNPSISRQLELDDESLTELAKWQTELAAASNDRLAEIANARRESAPFEIRLQAVSALSQRLVNGDGDTRGIELLMAELKGSTEPLLAALAKDALAELARRRATPRGRHEAPR